MKILIVYDSYFGNTEQIAHAIGNGVAGLGNAQIKQVGDITEMDFPGLDYLFVGSPTRKFTATKAIKDFIKEIPINELKGINTAAFDTRIDVQKINNRFLNMCVRLFGYAAEPLDEKLRKKGGRSILPPEGFYVLESEGPLKEGEYKRAMAWAKSAVTQHKGL